MGLDSSNVNDDNIMQQSTSTPAAASSSVPYDQSYSHLDDVPEQIRRQQRQKRLLDDVPVQIRNALNRARGERGAPIAPEAKRSRGDGGDAVAIGDDRYVLQLSCNSNNRTSKLECVRFVDLVGKCKEKELRMKDLGPADQHKMQLAMRKHWEKWCEFEAWKYYSQHDFDELVR